MAVVSFVVIMTFFFHPHESACYAVFFVVNVVVGVIRHVMADSVLVSVLVAMVAMVAVAATAFLSNVFDIIAL